MLIFSINLNSKERLAFPCPDGYDCDAYLRKLSVVWSLPRGAL